MLSRTAGASPIRTAPGTTTYDIYARYHELGDTNGPPDPTLAGNAPLPISKSQGAYWTVQLSALSDTQIASYNVLLIAPRYYLSLNTREREAPPTRFVDGGGVLWVDLGAGVEL